PIESLQANTTYYWRVKPKNDCTDGQFTSPSAFRTGTFACNVFEATDLPIFITGSGTPERTSTISIESSGAIQDVNIKGLKGDHEIFSDLEMTLISPLGTEVSLFKNKCGNSGAAFDLNLDDEASIAFNCSAIGLGWDHRPDSSLSKFIGEDIQGDWVLRINDNRATASGGIDAWGVEFCAPVSTEKPILANNVLFPVRKEGTRRITNEFLNISDNNFGPSEMEFTLVVNTEEGTLFLNNNPIQVGATFTQDDINEGRLKYGHDGGDIVVDHFTFVVVNPDGGFFGTPDFNISITEDVTTSNEEVTLEEDIILYPNPAYDELNIRFEKLETSNIQIDIMNVQGQHMQSASFGGQRLLNVDVSNYSNGIYFMRIQKGNAVITKKFEIFK
ncbi:MAG: T9SS type A sorting domain-containing protein, partial [Bacteroidota bacterium]